MAKGASSKEQITATILNTFAGSFKYDKEIRIPMVEDGETIQIKVTLTCAKVNVENGGDTAVPGATVATSPVIASAAVASKPVGTGTLTEPTADEKKAVADLVAKLGLA